MATVPKNPGQVLDPDFREHFLTDENDEMQRAIKNSDRYDWAPHAPVFLHHGTHDDVVPFFCAPHLPMLENAV